MLLISPNRFRRLLAFGTCLAFSFGYMEWAKTQSAFVFEIEATIITEAESLVSNFSHPIILCGILGQLVLLAVGVWPKVPRVWVMSALYLLSIPFLFIFLAGLVAVNLKMIASTLPFGVLTSIALYRLHNRKW